MKSEKLLKKVVDFKKLEEQDVAINIRSDGQLERRRITEDIEIVSKPENSGIDIFIRENAKNAVALIPVIITKSGLKDVVYNDFYVGKNAKVAIMAGCGIDNSGEKTSHHHGIHRFFVEPGAEVEYIEKHFASDHTAGLSILDPTTEIELAKGATLNMDTLQIAGVSRAKRVTKAKLGPDSTLRISEKIMTAKKEKASTEFYLEMLGENSSAHVVSRSVAVDNSKQTFRSQAIGKNACYAHIECDAIIKDHGRVEAIPSVDAKHIDARLIHEAAIGKIAGEQLTKLMTLGLSQERAEEVIIEGFLK